MGPPREGVRDHGQKMGTGEEVRAGFLADAMVADLARWLRILGEDCLWAPPDWDDDQVLLTAREDNRVVVSRDDQLVQRAKSMGLESVRVPQGPTERALIVVYQRTGSSPVTHRLATRCSLCNGWLEKVDAEEAVRRSRSAGRDPPLDEVLERHERFWCCTVCVQVFWRGTHWKEIQRVRRRVLQGLGLEEGENDDGGDVGDEGGHGDTGEGEDGGDGVTCRSRSASA